MKNNVQNLAIASVVLSLISACASTGQQHRADVYKAGQVNQAQEVQPINIIAVMPAKIEVDNTAQKKQAQVGGAILGAVLGAAITGGSGSKKPISGASAGLGAVVGGGVGAAAGSLVDDKALVDGVSITYTLNGKALNSAQVGRPCEFVIGQAILIKTTPMETRIQPNAECKKADS